MSLRLFRTLFNTGSPPLALTPPTDDTYKLNGDASMIGTTGLRALTVECVVGVYEQERRQLQPIVIQVELDYDFAAAAGADDVAHAVDYDRVAQGITELAQERKFHLIETMAEETANMILREHPPVQTVRLEIRKPHAVSAAECSFVRVERARR